MRHRKTTRKFGRDAAHHYALERNLLTSLVLHEKIKTTQAKARMVTRSFDKLVTRLRGQEPANQVRVLKEVFYSEIPGKKMTEVLLKRFEGASRTSGYTRTTRLMPRRGDNASMVLIELL